jgi:hypothetical protein
MQGGRVNVGEDGAVQGTGLAMAVFESFVAQDSAQATQRAKDLEESIRVAKATYPPGPAQRAAIKTATDTQRAAQLFLLRSWAGLASAIGPAVVGYVKANAEVSLADVNATIGTATSAGLVPDPAAPGAPLAPPPAAVSLPVTGPLGTLLKVA